MNTSLIWEMRNSHLFMRITTVMTLFFFLFTFYAPSVEAVTEGGEQQGDVSETIKGKTSEEKLSNTLQALKEHVKKDKARIKGRVQEEGGIVEDVLDFFGLSSLTNEDVQELETLNDVVRDLHYEAMANFATIEEELKDKGLPDEILQRHYEAVEKYLTEYEAFQQKMDKLYGAESLYDQETAIEELDEFLDKQQFKRKQQPFDPNDLPFGTPNGEDTRKPITDEKGLKEFLGQGTDDSTVFNTLLNSIIPEAQAQAGDGPTPADLAETIDVQITDAIQQKADELNNNPVEIYNWVRNNIEFIPTYGSIQGAEHTLRTGKGNAFDTSSLLIALLRASDIPARYAYGTIRIPIDEVMNWVGGVDVPEAATQLLAQGGIPTTGLTQGGVINFVQMEHIWVEAWVDFMPSRGAINNSPDSWVPLDASFKQYEYSTPTLDLSSLSYEGQELIENFNSGPQWDQNSQTTEFNDAVDSYIAAIDNIFDNSGEDIDSLFGRQRTIISEPPVLATGLPYDLVAKSNNFASIPDNLRHKVRYTLSNSNGFTFFDVIQYESSLPEIAGSELSVSFQPLTQTDRETLESFLPDSPDATIADLPDSIPGYLVKLSAQVNIDGVPVISDGQFTLGIDVKHQFSLFSPTKGWQSRTAIGASGEYRAIGIDLQGMDDVDVEELISELEGINEDVEEDPFVDKSRFVENLMQLGIQYYFALNDTFSEYQSTFSDVVAYRLPSFGYFHTTINTTYSFGLPRFVSFTGVTLDVPRIDSISWAKDNDPDKWLDYNSKVGLRASYLENAVPEDLFSTGETLPEGISAARALDIALSQGQTVYQIDSSNIADLNNVTIDADALQDITNSLNAGKVITVHESPVSVNGWTGSGYLVIDPDTGAGGYLISGGANGGFLGIDEATWLSLLSIGVDFIPGVGSVKSIIELITGRDPITGQPVNRFMAGISVLAGLVGGAGLVKGLTKASQKLVTAGKSSNEIGKLGEAAVNAAKGITKPATQADRTFKINGRTRIADGVQGNSIWEVKSVATLGGAKYERQIQDYLDFAKEEGLNFELFIRGPDFDVKTHITASMQKFLDDNNVVVKFIGEL